MLLEQIRQAFPHVVQSEKERTLCRSHAFGTARRPFPIRQTNVVPLILLDLGE
jgi:hypothetical protein